MAAAEECGLLGSTLVQFVTLILLLCEVFNSIFKNVSQSFNNVANKR